MTSLWLNAGVSLAFLLAGASHGGNEVLQAANQLSPSTPDSLSLHLDLAHPDSRDSSVIGLQLTLTNLTDQLLLLHTFRVGTLDERVVLLRDSSRVQQIAEDQHGPFIPNGFGTVIKPHSSTKELILLSRLYKLKTGDYQAYVTTGGAQAVRSNTLSFSYTEPK